MQGYKTDFLRFALSTGVLRFGEFRLKSGRVSPYFFNAGLFNTGRSLALLGRYYASAIEAVEISFDLLFGPAYKGIPLASATSIALADHHDRDIPFAFNRKEEKDHGEGGNIVGSPLEGRVLIIDDVITAGTAVQESVNIIRSRGASPVGLVIALDREERGQNERSAVEDVRERHGMPVFSIVTLTDLIQYLGESPANAEPLQAIQQYQAWYGT